MVENFIKNIKYSAADHKIAFTRVVEENLKILINLNKKLLKKSEIWRKPVGSLYFLTYYFFPSRDYHRQTYETNETRILKGAMTLIFLALVFKISLPEYPFKFIICYKMNNWGYIQRYEKIQYL